MPKFKQETITLDILNRLATIKNIYKNKNVHDTRISIKAYFDEDFYTVSVRIGGWLGTKVTVFEEIIIYPGEELNEQELINNLVLKYFIHL